MTSKYIYFVSYTCAKNGRLGSGMTEIQMDTPITHYGDLMKIIGKLMGAGVEQPIILNYQLLRVEEFNVS